MCGCGGQGCTLREKKDSLSDGGKKDKATDEPKTRLKQGQSRIEKRILEISFRASRGKRITTRLKTFRGVKEEAHEGMKSHNNISNLLWRWSYSPLVRRENYGRGKKIVAVH